MRRFLSVLVVVAVTCALAQSALATSGASTTPTAPSQSEYTENIPTAGHHGSGGGGGALIPVLIGLASAAAVIAAGGAAWRVSRRSHARRGSAGVPGSARG